MEFDDDDSSNNSYLPVYVTASKLSKDRLVLKRSFARSNGLNGRFCEIDLMNQQGKQWTLGLRYYKAKDEAYIRGGFKDFCLVNGLEVGSSYRFKLVRNGARPLLRLCSTQKENCFKANIKDNNLKKPSSECSERTSMKQVVIDEEGHGIDQHRALTCSISKDKVMIEQVVIDEEEEETREETEIPIKKRARVCAEGGTSSRNQASNKSNADPQTLQRKQPLQSCSISDKVKRVKQVIIDSLDGVKQIWSELEKKEQNLKALMLEIDALGEKASEINNILK